MPADQPTILATSGGIRAGRLTYFEFAELVHHAVELSGVSSRRPKVMMVAPATGDQEAHAARTHEAARVAGFDLTVLSLFPMPNVPDVRAAVLEQDVVWVWGGSVANLLAVWRVHDLGPVFREAWQSGVVLGGVSAGSLCWYVGGTTDSFGPELRPVTNGLAFLPYGSGVHYDTELRRRPLVHELVANGTLPPTHCTDDGVGLVYHGTELVEAVSERPGKGAYIVTRQGDEAVEERREPRRL